MHPTERYSVDKLDKNKKYIVEGIVLEQNYEMVDVWVKEIKEISGENEEQEKK